MSSIDPSLRAQQSQTEAVKSKKETSVVKAEKKVEASKEPVSNHKTEAKMKSPRTPEMIDLKQAGAEKLGKATGALSTNTVIRKLQETKQFKAKLKDSVNQMRNNPTEENKRIVKELVKNETLGLIVEKDREKIAEEFVKRTLDAEPESQLTHTTSTPTSTSSLPPTLILTNPDLEVPEPENLPPHEKPVTQKEEAKTERTKSRTLAEQGKELEVTKKTIKQIKAERSARHLSAPAPSASLTAPIARTTSRPKSVDPTELKRIKMNEQIIYEILTTETTHCEAQRNGMEILKAMELLAKSKETPVHPLIKEMLTQYESAYETSLTLLIKFSEAGNDPQKIAAVYQLPEFTVHCNALTKIAANFKEFLNEITKFKEESTDDATKIISTIFPGNNDLFNYDSTFVTSAQRLPRHLMLLSNLAGSTNEEKLTSALDNVKKLTSELNETIRVKDRSRELLKDKSLENLSQLNALLTKINVDRPLVLDKEGNFKIGKKSDINGSKEAFKAAIHLLAIAHESPNVDTGIQNKMEFLRGLVKNIGLVIADAALKDENIPDLDKKFYKNAMRRLDET